jgi:hypothetical protein
MMKMIDEVGPLTEQQFEACEAARAGTKPPSERPILFSHSMVRAILAGRKTQTRRIARSLSRCDAGEVGGRLWVRETWCQPDPMQRDAVYAADLDEHELKGIRELHRECGPGSYVPWRPSLHMPRWAARIVLEITELRLHRLGETTFAESQLEGFEGPYALGRFSVFWNKQHKARPGCHIDDNPWVWAISFRRLP